MVRPHEQGGRRLSQCGHFSDKRGRDQFFAFLLYGILSWGRPTTNDKVLYPLQILQNKIVGIICNVRKHEHKTINFLYQKLNVLTFRDIYQLEVTKFMYRHLYYHKKTS